MAVDDVPAAGARAEPADARWRHLRLDRRQRGCKPSRADGRGLRAGELRRDCDLAEGLHAKNNARHFSEDHDYILVYARNARRVEARTSSPALPSKTRVQESGRRPARPVDLRADSGSELLQQGNVRDYDAVTGAGNRWARRVDRTGATREKRSTSWWTTVGSGGGRTVQGMPRVKRFLSDVSGPDTADLLAALRSRTQPGCEEGTARARQFGSPTASSTRRSRPG